MTLEQSPLAGKRVLAFIGDIYEDLELCYPRYRLIEAGAPVRDGRTRAWRNEVHR